MWFFPLRLCSVVIDEQLLYLFLQRIAILSQQIFTRDSNFPAIKWVILKINKTYATPARELSIRTPCLVRNWSLDQHELCWFRVWVGPDVCSLIPNSSCRRKAGRLKRTSFSWHPGLNLSIWRGQSPLHLHSWRSWRSHRICPLRGSRWRGRKLLRQHLLPMHLWHSWRLRDDRERKEQEAENEGFLRHRSRHCWKETPTKCPQKSEAQTTVFILGWEKCLGKQTSVRIVWEMPTWFVQGKTWQWQTRVHLINLQCWATPCFCRKKVKGMKAF